MDKIPLHLPRLRPILQKVHKTGEFSLKNTQLLEENDHFFQKNTKTAKNKVFTPNNPHFQRLTFI
jgi:hypothetical protein